MPKITVNVTQKDIDEGAPKSQCLCPVALAIRALTRMKVYVCGHEVRFYVAKTHAIPYIAELPADASSFIRNFDAGVSVSPFSFYLEVPE